ncbi:MAG: alanine dehydrogenase [Dehalococcoidia bacterium]
MIIGAPTEIKSNEGRIALTPYGARELIGQGHTVLVESGAGNQSGFPDQEYLDAGAHIVAHAEEVWARADLVVKVKEPLQEEWPLLRDGQIVFTYFHFAASKDLTQAVLDSGCVAIAYETIRNGRGELPLLTPMSEIAGRIAIQDGARLLQRNFGGPGLLFAGVPGVEPARVVIYGGGVVGSNAARMAAGLGAQVVILDVSLDRLRYLSEVMPPNVTLVHSNRDTLLAHSSGADLIVGAVLLAGARPPSLLKRHDLALLQPGSVVMDVSVDQGGCVETTRATTHDDPIYEVDGVVHYGVANMPGVVPKTATRALTNATFPFLSAIAAKGWEKACGEDRGLAAGLSTVRGEVRCPEVARAHGFSRAAA